MTLQVSVTFVGQVVLVTFVVLETSVEIVEGMVPDIEDWRFPTYLKYVSMKIVVEAVEHPEAFASTATDVFDCNSWKWDEPSDFGQLTAEHLGDLELVRDLDGALAACVQMSVRCETTDDRQVFERDPFGHIVGVSERPYLFDECIDDGVNADACNCHSLDPSLRSGIPILPEDNVARASVASDSLVDAAVASWDVEWEETVV